MLGAGCGKVDSERGRVMRDGIFQLLLLRSPRQQGAPVDPHLHARLPGRRARLD
jgi:hypothetical protein